MYFGRRMGIDRQEIMNMRHGEMMDMIACYDIDHGLASPKRIYSFDEAMALL